MKLSEFLESEVASPDLHSIIMTIAQSCREISRAIIGADVSEAGTTNVYGEKQMALDVLADKLMSDQCRTNKAIGLIASEEIDGEHKIGEGRYAVVYDPLDGSSLIDVNLSVGTIWGVYETDTLIGVQGSEMKAAGFALYGPRTTLVFSLGNGTHEFTLKGNEFVLMKKNLQVGEGKMFAPGNLRVAREVEKYLKLNEYWICEGYTLRYSGGMVPDINQILVKGKGIFTYPGSPKAPDGKLRLLFECAPMAYLMEQAGGSATDGRMAILQKKVQRVDQASAILIGSKEEVRRAEEYLA